MAESAAPHHSQPFNAAGGRLQTNGPLRFHPAEDLGDLQLLFAPGANGQPDPSGDVALGFPAGGSANGTVVSTDGGETWQSFSILSGGRVADGHNNNFFRNFDEFSAGDAPDYLVLDIGGQQVLFFPSAGTAAGPLEGNIHLSEGAVAAVVCFLAGTRILTDLGERPVEALAPGDRVLTRDRGFQPLRWVGCSRVAPTEATWPVCVAAGAFGPGRPARDLCVSPQHRILMADPRLDLALALPEALVPALHLVNGTSVQRRRSDLPLSYYHLLFDRHEVIYSEGMPTESFHPGRWGLDVLDTATRAEILALFPELAADPDAFGAAARPALRRHEARVALG